MPKQRNSKSSSDNKSDIQQNQRKLSQQKQQPQQQINQQPKRKLSQIQNQVQSISQEHKQAQNIQYSKSQLQTQAPNRYTLYRQSYKQKWNMNDFDIHKAVQQFGGLQRYPQLQDSDQQSQNDKNQQNENQIKVRVYQTNKQTTGLNKKTTYTIKCKDKTGNYCIQFQVQNENKSGQFEITRYYHQFVILRQKLLLRWPGCFIPPIPTKKFGNNPYQLILIRMKFINNFLKYLNKVPQLYNGVQCQTFFKHEGQYAITNNKLIESQLQKLKSHTNEQLLQKYKQVFSNQVQQLTEQQQKIAITQIKQLQNELKSWKIDLTKFKDQIRSLINAKDKYYQAMTRLSTVLLPEFQSIILDWINDDKFNKLSSLELNQNKQNQNNTKQGYLLNTQQYGTALKDAALSVKNYNQSLWIIYDIFKFELKQTQAILQSIQCYDFLVKQMDFLNRNINLNKQQLQSLDEKKTTLKIFMMGGSSEQKKNRINKQSQQFEKRLTIVKQLLNYVLNVLINSIDNFHNDRAQSYKKQLGKSCFEQLVLIKKLMDFHLFELQTFRKKDLFNKSKSKLQEEITEE